MLIIWLLKTFRGTSWKGKDCDDLNPKVRPGVKPVGNDIAKDTNCNGIYVHDLIYFYQIYF